MKKKRFLLLLVCCIMAGEAIAETLSLQQAKVVAGDFMRNHAKRSVPMKLSHKITPNGAAVDKASLYVFSAERKNEGFVIVAGDSRVPAVLGYSDSGTFDEGEIPEALQQLLDSYAAQIQALGASEDIQLNSATREPIAPMLTTQWSQTAPYNMLLPMVNGTTRAVAGTATVAMAQVMNYYKWPQHPSKVIPAYTTSTLGISVPSLPISDFDWDLMSDCYLKNDTSSMNTAAVAKLMQYCAQSQALDFKVNSTVSTISKMLQAMTTYFDYKRGARVISRMNYSTAEWEDIIYNELVMQHPVICGAKKDNNYQAFVCDGCDTQGLFHVNWGLSGQYNGYFRLNVLNVDELGTGSAAWPSGFVSEQMAVVGLAPGANQMPSFGLTASKVTLHSYVNTRESFTQFFQAVVSGRFYNYTTQTMTIDFGWGLFNGDSVMVNIYGGYVSNLAPDSYVNNDERLLKFGYYVGDGTYTIRQIYSTRNAYNWHVCEGADKNYLEVVIRGDSCFITPHGNAAPVDVTVNGITTQGNMHPNRPIDITVNMTNNNDSEYNTLYMFVNGTRKGTAIVSAPQGESTDACFRYVPTTTGDHVLSFSFNQDGSEPVAADTLHIQAMPTANLTAVAQPLNVTDVSQKIIIDDKFALELAVTNTATTPYNEDISVALFKKQDNSTFLQLRALNQHLELESGETDTLLFELDEVVDNWQYYARAYYYSNGSQKTLCTTNTYTIRFPGQLENTWAVATSVDPAEGGMINFESGVNDSTAVADQTVVFSVTTNEGYKLNEVLVLTQEGDAVETAFEDGLYRFVMPQCDVTVVVSFLAYHNVTVANAVTAGGVVTVNADRATVGDEMSITARPNVGWRLQDVTATCGDDTLSLTVEGDGDIFRFIMPDEDVKVTAQFVRTTGDRFVLVTSVDELTADGIYMIANQRYDRAMKHFSADQRTFTGTEVGEWVDENKSILMASDQACMFSLSDKSDGSIFVNGDTTVFVKADLFTGNGYLMADNEDIVLVNSAPRTRAYLTFDSVANNCMIQYLEKPSQVSSQWPSMRYNNATDQFVILAGNDDPVWLYKLVDSHTVNVEDVTGGTVTVTSASLEDGTVQRGTEVTFIIQPDENHSVEGVVVTTTVGDTVEVLLDNETGIYSFVMPGSDVTITAQFELLPLRGDVNGDHAVNMDDLTVLINFLLTGDENLIVVELADCDNIDGVTMDDLTVLINFLLTGTW